MTVTLKGSSPSTLTAGILLLSRARSFGQRLQVEIIGAPDDISAVHGPALVHSPVLASCGVGRTLGAGALVVLPGPAEHPIATCLEPGGQGEWFLLDRAGEGRHPAARAVMTLSYARDPVRRELARRLRRALQTLGASAEPAVLDLLFGAPAPPLVRLALGLRAGRAISEHPDGALTRFLSMEPRPLIEPLAAPCTPAALDKAEADGRLDGVLEALSGDVRGEVRRWLVELGALAEHDPTGQLHALRCGLVEIGSQIAGLPPLGMLAPLEPAMDAVATRLGAALGASRGEHDASALLADTFRFLGGRFTPGARHPIVLDDKPVPSERLARWRWFCEATAGAAAEADALWRRVVEPAQ